MASETAKLIKNRIAASKPVVTGEWHAGFSKCKKYAEANKVPLIAVWSNGDSCGHCQIFESAVNNSYFRNWMKKSGCVFYFIYSGDGGDGAVGSKVFHWIRKNKNTAYPFVRIWWPAGKVDVATVGDTLDGQLSGEKGAKKCVSYLKKKLKSFFDQPIKPTPPPTATFTVTFTDGDGKNLLVESNVLSGTLLGNVRHPANPTKDGYDFDGWDVANDYVIDRDTVVNATWLKKEDPTPPGPTPPPDPELDIRSQMSSLTSSTGKFKNLKIDAKRQIMFSNNVSEIDVVSSLAESDIDKQFLTHIRLGTNVSALLPSCFAECGNLTAVYTTGNKLKDIGNRAFYCCSSLTDATFLQKDTNAKLYNIGLSAFAKTGLKDVNISLSGTSTATQIQAFAFADCPRLTSMTNIGSNYLADYEFAGCSALYSVNLANSHSFMGKYVFKDCINLSSIVIPPKTYMIGEGFLQGCSSLTSITFNESQEDPSLLNYDECLHNFMLSGTSLTSLTLPSAITSYAQIQPFAFAGLDKLCSIQFNGMPYNQIATQTSTKKTYKYKFGVVYTCCTSAWSGASSAVKKSYKYSNYFKETSLKECDKIITYCMEHDVPLVVFAGSKNTSECGSCWLFATKVLYTKTFLNWIPTANCIVVETDCNNSNVLPRMLEAITGRKNFNSNDRFAIIMMYWQTKNYKYFSDGNNNTTTSASKLVNRIKKAFKGYVQPNEITYTIDSSIFGTNCFGLNHDVTIYSNDKNNIKYKNSGSSSFSPIMSYQPQVIVDKLTKNEFKYGQWYYNAIELKAYADKYEIPVFALLESTACGPCEEFKATIFNNESFQNMMVAKKVLLCKCEDTTFTEREIGFLANSWMKKQTEDDPDGYAPGVMPILMIYQYQKRGATNGNGEYLPATYQMYAHYNSVEKASDPPNCPHLSSYAMVTAWIDENCPSEDTGYTPSAMFDLPQITSYTGQNDYPRYKVYENQANDTYGRYFPVKSLRTPESYETFDVTIDGVTQSLKGDFSEEQKPNFAAGTYQYFTMLSDDNPLYMTAYDVSGVIFKISGSLVKTSISSQAYEMDDDVLLNDVLDSANVDGESIIRDTSSFIDELYDLNDENQICVNVEQMEEMQSKYGFTFNVSTEIVTKDIALGGTTFNRIEVYLCCDPSYLTIDSEDSIFIPDDAMQYLYALSCNFFDAQVSKDTKLQWLSVFNNI